MDSDYIKSELEALKKLCSKCSCGIIPEAVQERIGNIFKELANK